MRYQQLCVEFSRETVNHTSYLGRDRVRSQTVVLGQRFRFEELEHLNGTLPRQIDLQQENNEHVSRNRNSE